MNALSFTQHTRTMTFGSLNATRYAKRCVRRCTALSMLSMLSIALSATLLAFAPANAQQTPEHHSPPHRRHRHDAQPRHPNRSTNDHHTRQSHLSDSTTRAIAKQLASPDISERHAALQTLNQQTTIPPTFVNQIVTLLDQEAKSYKPYIPDPTDTNDNSGPPEDASTEYATELIIAATHTHDPRTRLPLIKAGGLAVSDGVARFVAGGGPSLFPTLEGFAKTDPLRLANVINTYGLMYAKYPTLLHHADSAYVLGFFLAETGDTSTLASSELARIAPHIPIPEFTPLLTEIATNDPMHDAQFGYLRRKAAQTALTTLAPLWNALSARTLLAHTRLTLEGLCAISKRPLQSSCPAMTAALSTASTALNQRSPAQATATRALHDFQTRITTAERAGALAHRQAVFFNANTVAILARQ